MTHASTETLVALLDDELDELEERRTTRHVETCAPCAQDLARLTECRALFGWALQRMDTAEPPEWNTGLAAADGALAPQRAAPAEPSAPAMERSSARPRQTPLRWAAGLVLVAGAAAGAIMTPVIVDLVFTSEPAPAAPSSADVVPASGAVAVQPIEGAADIVLSGAVEPTHMAVTFEPRGDVMVDYVGDVPAFVARDGRISVRLTGASTMLRLRVPHDARAVRVLVDGRVAAVLSDGQLVRLRSDVGVTFEVVSAEH